MTDLPADAPVAALAIPGAQIVLGLNLHMCQPYTVFVKGEGLMATLALGRHAALVVNGTLARRATSDQMSFYHLRERMRRTLVATERGRAPIRLADQPLRALTTAFLWLALNEPQKGRVIRGLALHCLMDTKRVVIQIACGPEIAYVTRTSVNAQDMKDAMQLAVNAPGPLAIVQPPSSKRTVH